MSRAWRAVIVVGIVTLVAGGLRFWGLSRPPKKVFDEVYYASDGCWYAGLSPSSCGLEGDAERSWVHPPLGKQLIALGIEAFGNHPFGWRVAAAVAGTATVGLVGAMAFLLWGSPLWAGIAALLAGTEHLLFVQSRIAMLDVFLALFVVLGFFFLVWDRRRIDPPAEPTPWRTADDAEIKRPSSAAVRGSSWRPLLMLAGVAFGLAVAVKWSAGPALLGAMVLAVAWARTRQRRLGAGRPLLAGLRAEGPILYAALVAVPVVVYTLTWVPWLGDRRFDLLEFLRHHGDMAGYHLGLETVKESGEPIHPYMSRAWTWLLLLRPVAYYWQGDPSCCAEILGIGSPALFWGALLVIPYLALSWKGDWRAGAILVPVLSQYLPWLAVTRPLFLFYMTPITPFLALGLAHALRDLGRVRLGRWIAVPAVAIVVAVSVGVFAYFWPVLTADAITMEQWSARIWFYRGPSLLPNWV